MVPERFRRGREREGGSVDAKGEDRRRGEDRNRIRVRVVRKNRVKGFTERLPEERDTKRRVRGQARSDVRDGRTEAAEGS